jgi:hypothetical protein
VKWYHCVCGQREQSNGTTVYVDRESSQMVPLCMRTERAVKMYHCVRGQGQASHIPFISTFAIITHRRHPNYYYYSYYYYYYYSMLVSLSIPPSPSAPLPEPALPSFNKLLISSDWPKVGSFQMSRWYCYYEYASIL